MLYAGVCKYYQVLNQLSSLQIIIPSIWKSKVAVGLQKSMTACTCSSVTVPMSRKRSENRYRTGILLKKVIEKKTWVSGGDCETLFSAVKEGYSFWSCLWTFSVPSLCREEHDKRVHSLYVPCLFVFISWLRRFFRLFTHVAYFSCTTLIWCPSLPTLIYRELTGNRMYPKNKMALVQTCFTRKPLSPFFKPYGHIEAHARVFCFWQTYQCFTTLPHNEKLRCRA